MEFAAFCRAAQQVQAAFPRLADLDLESRCPRRKYLRRIRKLQLELLELQRRMAGKSLKMLVVFEGPDAAGKGGAIKRLTEHLDPRGFSVHSLAPPPAGRNSSHYLCRFWSRLPKPGRIAIFDDYSWYGRLLQERIEGLVDDATYRRAKREIRDFERTIIDEGYVLLKLWLHTSRGEQLKRFKRRMENPFKSWKLTPEDWRNHELFTEYCQLADAMFEATHTRQAPWRLIAAEDKLSSRLMVLKAVIEALQQSLGDPASPVREATELELLSRAPIACTSIPASAFQSRPSASSSSLGR